MTLNKHFMKGKPTLLIVMDGWGLGTGGAEDAVAQAHTPVFDRLWKKYAHTELMTHGAFVGLPTNKDMGGSEVGHLTMGAGMILDQGPTRINHAIQNASFYSSDALAKIIEKVQNGTTLHLLGLLSDGNIHSHIDHFIALAEYAFKQGVQRLRVHALLDGRDVGIQSAQDYVQQLEDVFANIAAQGGDYAFATAGGRERIIMDRDQDWSKVKLGWDAMVHGVSQHRFTSMQGAIQFLRSENPGIIDQDLSGFVIVDAQDKPVGSIQDGDAVVMMNFRGDRAIEITEAFEVDDFMGFEREKRPDILFSGMMVYDEDRDLPALQLMGPTKVDKPFGKRILELGIKQFRLTETQKYPHVTFFFNGGYRKPLDAAMEDYILIASDQGISFADVPVMKSVEIADKAVALIASGDYGFGLMNFANADMVGHCGVIEPAIQAIEAVDQAVGRILEALEKVGGCALITADHGNAEEMQIFKHGEAEACTKHSINAVPCILFDPAFDGSYDLRQPKQSDDIATRPGLSHVAATLFDMMGYDAPSDLNASLLK
ncbi:MAG: 2,3-bisphosphoglycerate-independent phosphoglycerate mutase [Mariprofundaceae bacterium]|nr:2,3-bisphosphoglycerate-independent phosphoglycerate mutase [Mariprofundaceae bacterium]